MPHLRVNRKLESFLTVHKPIKVAIGGRGSGKSIGFGDMFTMKMDTEGADIYCLREFQDSVSDSVHRVFRDSIQKRLELTGWQIFENRVIAPNGARTVYKGANRNPDSMQSAQGFKYSWFEEAHRASEDSLDKLLPTIIRNPGAECWFSGNPQSSSDPFSARLIVPYLDKLEKDGYYEDDVHLIVMVNWRDNPWWNDEQEQIRAWDKENISPAKYDWIWEGKFFDAYDDSIIEPDWFDSAIDAHKKLGFKAEGVRSLGFDPADEGGDSKAYAYRYGVVVTEVEQWSDGDVTDAIDRAFDVAFDRRCTDFVYDGIGVGTGVKVALSRKDPKDGMTATAFISSEEAENPEELYKDGRTNRDTFRNRRAQGWWYLRDRFEKTHRAVKKGEYINPDELISIDSNIKHLMALRSEVCRVRRKRGAANTRLQVESKDDMRRRQMPSPNMADALVYAFSNPPPFTISKYDFKVNTGYMV